ncbi:MAG: peroxiredoxin [candidate division Zixibacteria bacterium]|nr:peroxiredoxin [candidate division Zixibacteria bacterium]
MKIGRLFIFVAALTVTALFGAERISAMALQVGDTLPEFQLPYATQDSISMDGLGSGDLKGKRYLLAFYPADWSGGCTREMCGFRDAITQFESLNVEVLPISADLVYSHREWAKHHNLPFRLLADQTRDFGKKMGVYQEDRGMFKRSVFVVGPDGKLEYIDYEYSVADDSDFDELKAFLAGKK